jgi:signal transduction histidine kinase
MHIEAIAPDSTDLPTRRIMTVHNRLPYWLFVMVYATLVTVSGNLAGKAYATLMTRERQVRDLRQSLLARTREAAIQQERNRLARELHDSIKQQIFSISMGAAAVEARWESDSQGAQEALGDVRRSAREAMAEMNALLQQLSPAPLEKVGLVQALRDQCEALGYRTGAEVTVEFGELPPDEYLPAGAQEDIFRIAQEAFSNVARHARAEHVRLYVGQRDTDGPLVLEIQDDGQGFDVDAAESGMGLENIRQRALALRGELVVESAPDKGATLRISIPLVNSIVEGDMSMYKQDHTLNRVFLVGIGGGLALIAALFYPLYVLVPGGRVAGWPVGSGVIGLILEIVAVLVTVAIGFMAARWGRADTRQSGALFGALAGGVAGAILYFGIGAAAAGVVGGDSLLRHGLVPVTGNADMARMMVFESLVGIAWWSHGVFWAALLAGVGLGAIGGFWAPPEAELYEQLPQRLVATPILIASFLFSTLSLIVSVPYFSQIEAFVREGRLEQFISGELTWPLADMLVDISFWCISTPMVFYLASLIALYFSLRAEAETQDPARLDKVFTRVAILGLASLMMPIYVLLVNPGLIRLVSAVGVVAAVTVTGSLVLGGLYLTTFFQIRQRRRALGLDRSHPIQTVAAISALLSLGLVVWATTLPYASSVSVGLAVIIANVVLVVFVEIWRQRVPDSGRFYVVQTAAVISVLLSLITVSWAVSLSPLATILVGLVVIVANGVLIVILRRQPKRAPRDTGALPRLRLAVSQSISSGLGVVVAMLVPLMANLGTAVSVAMIPVRWKEVLDSLALSPTLNYTLIELVRGVYLAQARVFLVSFVAAIALVGLRMLVFSGIMAISKRRA